VFLRVKVYVTGVFALVDPKLKLAPSSATTFAAVGAAITGIVKANARVQRNSNVDFSFIVTTNVPLLNYSTYKPSLACVDKGIMAEYRQAQTIGEFRLDPYFF
jgi:hypothetical protein